MITPFIRLARHFACRRLPNPTAAAAHGRSVRMGPGNLCLVLSYWIRHISTRVAEAPSQKDDRDLGSSRTRVSKPVTIQSS